MKIQADAQAREAEMQLKDQLNQRDNETKLLIANINTSKQDDGIEEPEFSEEARAKLLESMRQFDERIQLDRERLAFDKQKADTDASIKRESLRRKPKTTSK